MPDNFTASDLSLLSADDHGKDGAAATPHGTDPEEALRAQTIDLNIWRRFWLRRRLRFGAWRAKRHANQFGEEAYGRFFKENARHFGEEIKEYIPADLKQRLKGFLDGGGEPFLIVRGVFSRRFPQRCLIRPLTDDLNGSSPRKIVTDEAKKLLSGRRYNLVASGLIAAMGVEMSSKGLDDPVYRDFVTDTGAEQDQFEDDFDMHLRYRTATPNCSPATGEAARIVLFACIENPIRDPIYLVRTDEVVKLLSERTQKILRDTEFRFFNTRDTAKFALSQTIAIKHILYDGPSESGPWLSYDPEMLDLGYVSSMLERLSALTELNTKIRQCAVGSARKIVLRRGDALIVDSYRALTRRYEQGHTYFDFRPLGRPPIRWLRVYYGFPKSARRWTKLAE